MKTSLVPLKKSKDLAGNRAEDLTENRGTLCANWKRGCNGVTEGADTTGRLTYCDDCAHQYK